MPEQLLPAKGATASTQAARGKLPLWLRWASLVWLLIWVLVYWRTWGAANFLHLCDVAVILTCAGLWANNALLISSQAVAALAADLAWAAVAAWRIFFGRYLTGGMEYLADGRYPLWIRLLSLYHVAIPAVLVWAVARIGYDRRGWGLQSAIAAAVFAASRFTAPDENINFAFRDPFFHRSFGPPAVHAALSALFMIFAVYFPTHLILKRLFPRTGATRGIGEHSRRIRAT
jgi:hypothetical protein